MVATRSITLRYFALLREQRGIEEERIDTDAGTAEELYSFLARAHGFTLAADRIRVAINDRFEDNATPLRDGDTVVFIPPVAGG